MFNFGKHSKVKKRLELLTNGKSLAEFIFTTEVLEDLPAQLGRVVEATFPGRVAYGVTVNPTFAFLLFLNGWSCAMATFFETTDLSSVQSEADFTELIEEFVFKFQDAMPREGNDVLFNTVAGGLKIQDDHWYHYLSAFMIGWHCSVNMLKVIFESFAYDSPEAARALKVDSRKQFERAAAIVLDFQSGMLKL